MEVGFLEAPSIKITTIRRKNLKSLIQMLLLKPKLQIYVKRNKILNKKVAGYIR